MYYACSKTQASRYPCTGAITAAPGHHYPRHQLHRYCPRTTKHPVCPLCCSQSLYVRVRVILAYLRIRVRWPAHLCGQNRRHKIGPFVTNCFSQTICQLIIQIWRVAQGSFSPVDAKLSCDCLLTRLDWFSVCLLHLLFNASIIQPSYTTMTQKGALRIYQVWYMARHSLHITHKHIAY